MNSSHGGSLLLLLLEEVVVVDPVLLGPVSGVMAGASAIIPVLAGRPRSVDVHRAGPSAAVAPAAQARNRQDHVRLSVRDAQSHQVAVGRMGLLYLKDQKQKNTNTFKRESIRGSDSGARRRRGDNHVR